MKHRNVNGNGKDSQGRDHDGGYDARQPYQAAWSVGGNRFFSPNTMFVIGHALVVDDGVSA